MAPPLFAICGLAFPDTSLEEDIQIAAACGAAGLSISESKLTDQDPAEIAVELHDRGLRAAVCVPTVMSFFALPDMPGPDTFNERVDSMCKSVRRLALLGADSMLCLTGPAGHHSAQAARSLSLEALRRVADEAGQAGMTLAFEPFRYTSPSRWSIVFGLEAAIEFLDEAGMPNVGVCYDVWHLWDSADTILDDTLRHASRVAVVHVSDYREPTRSWYDRVLPGDGVIDLTEIFARLRDGGFEGWYDLEVFSDDGRFGDDFPDSVWKLPPVEIARRGREGFLRAWRGSTGH
jgi:sugar phosphate isomerase/epimerase